MQFLHLQTMLEDVGADMSVILLAIRIVMYNYRYNL